jgi:hypothetical protein
MAHHAKIENGIVTQVIVTMDSDEDTFSDRMLAETGETWIRTSYNAAKNGFRYNYAGIGYTYDHSNEVFYAPQPFASWTLSQTTWLWEPPVAYPDDGKMYRWDEATVGWILVPVSE